MKFKNSIALDGTFLYCELKNAIKINHVTLFNLSINKDLIYLKK